MNQFDGLAKGPIIGCIVEGQGSELKASFKSEKGGTREEDEPSIPRGNDAHMFAQAD